MDDPRYSTYSAITDRPRLRWPGNARVALWVAPNVEFYEYEPPPSTFRNAWSRMPHPDVLHYGYRDYGNSVGFWRMLEVLDKHRVRASVFEHGRPGPFPGDPRRDGGPQLGLHGPRLLQHAHLTATRSRRSGPYWQDNIATVKQHTGKQLKGRLGAGCCNTANTPDLMAESDCTYHTDWMMTISRSRSRSKRGRLIMPPLQLSAKRCGAVRGPGLEADYFAQMIKDQFDVLYEEGAETGKVMCIALHPFLIGQPHRVRYLDDIFRTSWRATGSG